MAASAKIFVIRIFLNKILLLGKKVMVTWWHMAWNGFQFLFLVFFQCRDCFRVDLKDLSCNSWIKKNFALMLPFFILIFFCIVCSSRLFSRTSSFWWYARDIHIECSKQFIWNSYFYVSGPEYDRSCIFDIRPKPKFSLWKIRPSAEGLSRSRRYEIL